MLLQVRPRKYEVLKLYFLLTNTLPLQILNLMFVITSKTSYSAGESDKIISILTFSLEYAYKKISLKVVSVCEYHPS